MMLRSVISLNTSYLSQCTLEMWWGWCQTALAPIETHRCSTMLCCTREFYVPCCGSARKLRFCPYCESYGSCEAVYRFLLPLDEVLRCGSVIALYTQLASNWPTRVHVAVYTATRRAVVDRRRVQPVLPDFLGSQSPKYHPKQPQYDGAWQTLSM